jgi:hypothetical protein
LVQISFESHLSFLSFEVSFFGEVNFKGKFWNSKLYVSKVLVPVNLIEADLDFSQSRIHVSQQQLFLRSLFLENTIFRMNKLNLTTWQ